MKDPNASTRRPRLRTPGVVVLLASISLIPLLGIGWLAGAEVADSRRERQQTEAINRAAQQLEQSIELQSLLNEEAYWSHSLAAVATFGIPTELVVVLTGLDIEGGLAQARSDVDTALSQPDVPPKAAERLEEIRAGVQPGARVESIRTGFEDVSRLAQQNVRQDIDDLVDASDQLGNSGALSNSIQTLDLAIQAQHEATQMVEGYFSTRFPVGDPVEAEVQRTLGAELRYAEAISQLEWRADLTPSIGTALDDVTGSTHQRWLAERVEDVRLDLFTSGLESPSFSQEINLGVAQQEIGTFESAQEVLDDHTDLVRLAAFVVAEESAAVRDAAAARERRTVGFTIALVAVAVAAVAFGSVWIAGPLRRMSVAVQQLQDGRPVGTVPEGGPREVRLAARALNEALENMSVAENMATALADRDLDNPVFGRPASGRLGASLRNAVNQLASSMSEGEAYRAQLAHEAAHDGLTGLRNRGEIMGKLQRALERSRATESPLAALYIDLDGFKFINDAHGHAIGDEVLCETARRIQNCARRKDSVGRLGGDEFVVVATSVDNVEAALRLGERIRTEVGKPITVEGVDYQVTASVGVAVAAASVTGAQLLREADLALYEAKAAGRNQVHFCDEDLKNRQTEQSSIERRLEQAIAGNDLTLYYQPVIDSSTLALRSVEALLRWPQPDGGFVSPAVFIGVAEQSDLILRIDEWVLDSVCRQLARWEGTPLLAEVATSINLSARSVSRPDLAERVLQHLRAHGARPDLLTIEVTETALLDDARTAAVSLSELRAAGVKVAIDDFGTGFASLAQLRRLPLDVLKIDQGFVSNIDRPDDHSLIQLTIDTGHLLGAEIVAEGVETENQRRLLTVMGADLLQGYHLARPMSTDQLDIWAAEQAGSAVVD